MAAWVLLMLLLPLLPLLLLLLLLLGGLPCELDDVRLMEVSDRCRIVV